MAYAGGEGGGARYKVVSLDGTVISRSGAMTGGNCAPPRQRSMDPAAYAALKQRRAETAAYVEQRRDGEPGLVAAAAAAAKAVESASTSMKFIALARPLPLSGFIPAFSRPALAPPPPPPARPSARALLRTVRRT